VVVTLPICLKAPGSSPRRCASRTLSTSLPRSLIEAARLDGAGNWTVLRKIVILLSRGPLITA
jgi:ABC-type Fe3+ transport system permease subunit